MGNGGTVEEESDVGRVRIKIGDEGGDGDCSSSSCAFPAAGKGSDIDICSSCSSVFPVCHTTYRPNYFVYDASKPDAVRQYYGGVPRFIEVNEHSYV